jgi:aminopeptidase C
MKIYKLIDLENHKKLGEWKVENWWEIDVGILGITLAETANRDKYRWTVER